MDGEVYDEQKYTYGEKIEQIPVDIEGYTFSGWKYGYKEVPETMPSCNIELKGTLTVRNFVLQYYVDGELYTSRTYAYGDTITYIFEPTQSGKVFSGWSYANGALPATMPAHNVRIDGSFDQTEFKVTYYIDDVLSKTVSVMKGYMIPAYLPEKEGYSFSGWMVGTGNEQYALPEVMPAENLTVYGTFSVNIYTIILDTQGGSNIDAIVQAYGTSITKPQNPTKTGYTFAGWDMEIPATMPAENITITATWKVNTYTITFDTAGGNAIKDITGEYGTVITKPANPVKTGHTFAGWDKSIPNIMPDYNLVITAKWTVNTYTIIFDTQGGSNIDAIVQAYGTAITKPTNPTKTGFTFAGWDIQIPATMPAYENGSITITAKWEYIPYGITYVLNSDTLKGEFVVEGGIHLAQYGVTSTLNIARPITYGKYYYFTGWFTEANGGIQVTDGSGKLLPNIDGGTDSEGKWIYTASDSLTLYAQWKQTKEDFIYIFNEEDFDNIRNNLSGKYLLLEDINLNDSVWSSISSFAGELDGGGHTISHAMVSIGGYKTAGSTTGGFFKELASSAVIRNVRFTNISVSIQNDDYTSGISNKENTIYCGILCGKNSGTIENVELDGCSITSYFYKYEAGGSGIADKVTHAGGIAGINYGTISYSKVNNTTVTAGSKSGTTGRGKWNYIGGICGTNQGKIETCSSTNNTLTGVTYEGKTGHYISDFAGSNSGNITSDCFKENNTISG